MGLEYREQEEAFRQYREDSQLATKENHETIAHLKENEALKKMKELYLREPISAESSATLPGELCHHEKHLSGGTEQLELYKHQLKVYQEDLAVERREEERLKEEKENERLWLQAEVTSLQLQLDRCRTELSHYSSETTRLAHQLKIRCQADQEQYRRSLESKGYIAWSPDVPLPPLDSYVEADHTHHTLSYQSNAAGIRDCIPTLLS